MRPERVRSADPEAFGEITGREEEWRFTPLDRVRVLLDGAPSDARLQVESELPEGVELVEVATADLDVPAPVDRLAALARAAVGLGARRARPQGPRGRRARSCCG